MKITLDIDGDFLVPAGKLAERTRQPLKAIVEHGLRLALEQSEALEQFRMLDCDYGDPEASDPLEKLNWQNLRDHLYTEV